ncbi:unnamed protein product, partial [marine sediment metagenome]
VSIAFPINYKIDTAIGQEKYPIFSETGYLVTSSKSAILIDAHSGRVLWEKNPHKKQSPASITKIMTAIIAIENGYTIKAGSCLVASAKKDDINLIGVVLDSEPGFFQPFPYLKISFYLL